MNKFWIFAVLPLGVTPFSSQSGESGVSFRRTQKPLKTQVNVQREQRGFAVKIDAKTKKIIFQAWFYSARNTVNERKQLAAIMKFWRKQNGRYIYRIGKGEGAIDFDIVFDLRQAPGIYTETGFFFPDPSVDLKILNQIEVVPSDQMNKLLKLASGTRVVGYAPNNFVYIAEDMADFTWIGIHEAGHRLGAGHHSHGVMNPALEQVSPNLSKAAVRQMLACGNIIGKTRHHSHLKHYPVVAADIQVVGELPRGFYTSGRVKRAKKK